MYISTPYFKTKGLCQITLAFLLLLISENKNIDGNGTNGDSDDGTDWYYSDEDYSDGEYD